MILLVFVPISIIYMIAVYHKELSKRVRKDNNFSRNLIIITSLFSHIAILLHLISIVFRFDGHYVFMLIAVISIVVSLGTSLFYFIKNFKKFDFYIPSEFFVVVTPSLLLIGIFSLTSHVPKSKFTSLEKNITLIEQNNRFIIGHHTIDSIALVSYQIISNLEDMLIEKSGGYNQFGELVNGKSRDHFTSLMIRQKGIEELKTAIAIVPLLQEKEIPWLEHEKMYNITVSDGVIKLKLLKNKVLISGVK